MDDQTELVLLFCALILTLAVLFGGWGIPLAALLLAWIIFTKTFKKD